MLNREQILKSARQLVQSRGLPMKIYGLKEEAEAVVVYFTAEKRVPLKDLARDLEFEFNLPIRLEQIPKKELGKIGKTDVLGDSGCCATFSSHCLFRDKYGCGYGFETGVNGVNASIASVEKTPQITQTPQLPQKPKKKKKKMVRRLVM